jgi:hypothetical protein
MTLEGARDQGRERVMSGLDELARKLWTVQRFGLSPRKVIARLGNRSEPRVLCISLPKAGTHLLERALCLHPRLYRKLVHTVHESNIDDRGLARLLAGLAPGQIVLAHLLHSEQRQRLVEESGMRCIFLVRDPRDLVVSEACYLMTNTRHDYHDALRDARERKTAILRCIEGVPATGLPSIGVVLSGMEGWLDSGCHVMRFEDLIGSPGAAQRAASERRSGRSTTSSGCTSTRPGFLHWADVSSRAPVRPSGAGRSGSGGSISTPR